MTFNILLIIGVLIIYLLTHQGNNKKKKLQDELFLKIIFFLFFILVGSREMTRGNDTQMYLSLFERCAINKWSIVRFDSYFEGGYLALNVLLSYISTSKRFFMYIMSLIFNYGIYKFIKNNSKNYLLSVLIYICFLFLYTSMTMMRQYCAVIIVLLAFRYVKRKKLLKFIITIYLATLFHRTAWIALLIYPMYHLPFKKKNIIITFLIAIGITIFIGPVIRVIANIIGKNYYYESRIGSDNLSNILYTLVYFSMFIFGLFTKRKKENIKDKKEIDFYLYNFLFACLINLIATNMNILARASIYFNIFTIISLPNLILINIKDKINTKIIYIAIFMFLILYSSTIIKFRPNWNTAYDYKSCLFFVEDNYVCK